MNGSFEQLGAFTSLEGGRYLETADLTGWSIAGAPVAQLIANGPFPASDGLGWIDADASSSNLGRSETLAGLASGAVYRLFVDFGYYFGQGLSLRLSFGGQTLGDVDGATPWTSVNFDVLGGPGDGSDLLSIADLGPPTAAGAGCDKVRLFALGAGDDDTIDRGSAADRMAGGGGIETPALWTTPTT